jgi:hypothetical protein
LKLFGRGDGVLTQIGIDAVAERIARAYLRRQPFWYPGCSNPRVWEAAAEALVRLNRKDPAIPVDPELFVASQPIDSPLSDPWQDLTQTRAVRRYEKRVRRIIRDLRAELVAEIRQVECRVRKGQTLESVLHTRTQSLSPLGRYIVAYRARRGDLAEMFRGQAEEQHLSCPLYRHACRRLLPRDAYPVSESLLPGRASRDTAKIALFSLN